MKIDRTTKYDNIINLPHPSSKKHPRMAVSDRAAQFAPFSALTGYEDAIGETARLTDEKIELDEYEKLAISDTLNKITENISAHPHVSLTYFICDKRKNGGKYESVFGRVEKNDIQSGEIIMQSGKKVPFSDIIYIEMVKDPDSGK